MAKKRKIGEETLRKFNLFQYKKELNSLAEKTKEQYKPKLGRLMKRLKQKIARAEKK